jgi:hypothetical protein
MISPSRRPAPAAENVHYSPALTSAVAMVFPGANAELLHPAEQRLLVLKTVWRPVSALVFTKVHRVGERVFGWM